MCLVTCHTENHSMDFRILEVFWNLSSKELAKWRLVFVNISTFCFSWIGRSASLAWSIWPSSAHFHKPTWLLFRYLAVIRTDVTPWCSDQVQTQVSICMSPCTSNSWCHHVHPIHDDLRYWRSLAAFLIHGITILFDAKVQKKQILLK